MSNSTMTTGATTPAALRRLWAALLVVAMTMGLATTTSAAALADDLVTSGSVDADGTAFASYDVTADGDGTIAATLGWAGSADLALFVREVQDAGASPVGPLLSTSRTSAQPEQLSFEATSGTTYRLIVQAIEGAASFDLEALLQTGDTRTFLGTSDLPNNAVYRAHPITVPTDGLLAAELRWDDPAADLGLYLRRTDGTVVDVARSDAPTERLSAELPAGEYEYLVRAEQGASPYTLDVQAVQSGATRDVIGSIGYQAAGGGTQVYDAYDITAATTGTLVATLEAADAGANLDLFARPFDGATLGPIAVSSATSVDTEQLSLDVEAGDVVRLLVKATAGSSAFTLSTDVETGAERTYRFTSDPASQNWRTIPYEVPAPGAVTATLTGDGAADLQLYLRRPDGSLGEVLKTDAQPEVFTHDAATAGTYQLIATSASGATDWTLATRFQDAFERQLAGQVGFTSARGVQAFESYDVTAPSDGLASVLVTPTDGDANLNLYARRVDDPAAATPGPLLAFSVTAADPEALSFGVEAGETYRVYVEAESGASHFLADVMLDTEAFPTYVGTVDLDSQRYRSYDVELASGGELTASLAWTNGANLALFLQDDDGATIASSATGDNPEGVTATVPAGSYRLTVRSDDGAAAFELATAFEAVEPPEGCDPVSPDPCDTLAVATPFALDFSGDEGGLSDADGDDLGFTLVDAPSRRDDVDQAPAPATASDPDVPGYEPTLLDVDGGNLTVTATKGIQFSQPADEATAGQASSSDTNSQLNGLGVAVAAGEDAYELTTTLVAPEFGSTNGFQQGGLWWFVDEDTYVKLAVQRQSGSENKVQLAVESLAAPTSDAADGFAELSSANVPDGQDVALRMEVDTVDGVVRGYYTVAGGTEVQVTADGVEQLVLPDALVDGVSIDDGGDAVVNAGLFATKRRAAATSDMTATFADFGVTVPDAGDTTPPTDVVLEATAGDGEVELTWTGGEDDGDVTFDVFRSETSPVDTTGAPLGSDVEGTAFLDTGLTNDTTYHYVVTATDEAGNTTASNEVSATPAAPVEGCDPVSPDPCDTLAVATPFALDFSGDEGGLSDTDGDDLGFTLVDAPSNREGTDQAPAPVAPSDPDVPGFEPSLLDVDGGQLTITATKGINFVQPSSDGGTRTSTETNTQLNALGAAVAGGQDGYELTTTVVAPDFAGSNGSQQGGLLWFVDEDTYVKLVVARTGSGTNKVQMAVESIDAPTADSADGFAELNGPSFTNGQDVTLRMEVDADDGVVRGFYAIEDGPESQVTQDGVEQLVLPAALVDGVSIDGAGAATVNAGLFATKRRSAAATTTTATFADFAVTTTDAPVEDVALSVNFQSEEASVPPGHVRDFGEAYGERTGTDQGDGLTYGWVEQDDLSQPLDLVGKGRDRGTNPDQRFDTLVHMQLPGSNGAPAPDEGAWQLAVPNGTYDVTVAVGDPNLGGDPESHTINVEGVNAIDGFPKSSAPNGDPARHTTATVTVTVTDGQLTIDAIGGENTKLNFVEVSTNDGTLGDDPVFLDVADRTVTEGQLVLVPAGASDPDGGDVSIALTDGPAWLSWNAADGRVEGTVPDDAGATTVTVELTATDDEGATATETFELTVEVALDLAVNFQPTDAEPPAGFLRDSGDGFAERTGAGQGSGLSYGWVTTSDGSPLDLTTNTRDRGRSPGVDQLDDTIIHLQYGDTGGTSSNTTEGAWEIALPDGAYRVTVTVGDQPGQGGVYDSTHVVNAEDGVLLEAFQSTAAEEFGTFTGDVGVVDGRLTLSPVGGTNTKLTQVEITSLGQLPFVTTPIPANRSTDALLDTNVSGAVSVPGAGVGVDPRDTSLNADTVKLFEVVEGGADVEIAATRGSTGGNDTISVAPDEPLQPETTYRFVVDGALDENGYTFLPYTSLFTTGAEQSTGGGGGEFEPVTGVDFEKVDLGIDDKFFSSLVVHEGYLWATTIGQGTFRYEILPDGTLGPELDLNLFGGRAAIGFVFDEVDPTVAWFTHSTANTSSESQEFGSKVSRVDFGSDLDSEAQVTSPTVDDVFVNLPRSLKDHLANSMAYGPSGDADNRWLYFLQGSNQAAGDVDSSWGLRTETALTAAVLRFDPVESWADVQANGPIDVQTEDGGTYDPFAPDAPLEVYATGIRNAYDLVFHSNGSLYVPTNGTAGGGSSANSPGVEIDGNGTHTMTTNYNPGGQNEDAGRDLTDICQDNRVDGQPYSGGEVPAASHPTQRDFLFEVVEGGYYGHPNPERCEFVLNNGGDPVFDGQDGTGYGPSVDPDPNYRGFAFNFEFNKSPNGAIEYTSNTFDGALQGRLMVVRFSGNNDILTMQVAGDGTVLGAQPGTDIGGFAADYRDPLDVTEDTTVNPGNLYLNQFARGQNGAQKLFLLRVPEGEQAGAISVDPEAARLSATLNGEQPTDTETVTVTNDGDETVTLSADVIGDDADDFDVELADTTLAGGASTTATITFDPNGSTTGTRTATAELTAGDESAEVSLRALAFQGQFGGEEPTLQQVTDTLEYGITTGWSGLAGGTSPAAQGDEVLEPLFERASDGPVTMTPVAAFAPFEALPFGWYVDDGNGGATLNEVGVMASGQQQTLDPTLSSGGVSFDPGTDPFGTYYFSNTFDRTGYTEDARNDGDNGVVHRARIYPLSGDRFLVAFEDASNGDYQDYVFVLDNVVAADDGAGNGGGGNTGGGTGDALKVNFQSETAPVPADHVRDVGEAYGARTGADQGDGLVYGWVDDETFEPLDLVGNGRDRGENDDQRLDTLMHMDLPPDNAGGTLADGSWELAVDDGAYEVTVSVGDADNGGAPESHTINVEGVSAIDGFPKSGAADGADERHSQATVTVEVLDGKLTIDQTGGTNTKINYLEITPQDGGGGDGEVVAQVNFQPAASTTPQGWDADTGALFTTGRGYGWVRTEGGADKTDDTRDRAGDPDPLTATTIIVDDDTVDAVVDGEWELAVADGTYTVEVSVGDAGFGDSTHTVLAEGQTVVDGFAPTGAGDYGTGSATVEVSDGRLTVASGGGNTKLQWIRVTGEDGVDTVPPRVELEVSGDQIGDAYANDATVTARVTDATLEFNEFVLDGGPSTAYTEPVVVTGPGEHTFELTATDGAGNTTVESVTFDIVAFETTDGELTLTNPEAAPFDDRLVMSRIESDKDDPKTNETATVVVGNDGTEPFDIVSLAIDGGGFEVTSPTTLPVTVPVGDSVSIDVLMTAVGTGSNQIFEADLRIGHEASNGPESVVELAGMWQSVEEGGNEPNVVEIVETFGFGTTIVGPGQQLNNQGRLEAIGDEVLSQYWERADAGQPVTIRQLAAYHTCCNNTASFRWHVEGQKNNQTTVLVHDGEWAQSLLPRINGSDTQPALATFTPSEQRFGLRVDPESSDWELNNTAPDQCGQGNEGCQLGHHLRVWPAEDRDGVAIPDLWIVVMDYAGINYDFNDNVYLVSNITPAGTADTTAPDAPEGLTSLGGDPDVALDWSDNAEDDLAGYHVERSTGGAFSRITTDLLTASELTDTSAPAGTTVTYRVVAVDDVGNESDPSATTSIDTEEGDGPEPIRINAGGPAVTDLGVDWEADRAFTGGKAYTNDQAEVSVLYQSEHSATGDQQPFAYDIPVADGTYTVNLHLAEIYFGATGGGPGGAGQRVFSANLEGGAVELADYDINADVGPQTAVVQSFTVTVTDGNLDIDFTASTDQPKVSAIEVLAG